VFGRESGSVYPAYVDNLIMSALFLSMWIAWGKLLGTLTASISQHLYDPGNVVWLVIYVEILVLDVFYVILLSKAPRYQRDEISADPATASI